MNRNLYLWNLKDHTYKQVNDYPVNIYSANFIQGTDWYIYQNDETNEVYVIDATNGKLLKKFNPKFASYGQQVNKDLTRYAGSEEKQLMHIMSLLNGSQMISGRPVIHFMASGKLWQPHFTPNQNEIYATAGFGEFWIWNSHNGKELKSIVKNVGQTMSAISSDGKYIYTSDQGFSGIRYNVQTGKIDASKKSALYMPDNVADITYLKNDHNKSFLINKLTNFRFIDKDKIITTYGGVQYPFLWAVLYTPSKFDWSGNNKYKRPIFYSKQFLPLAPDPLTFSKGLYGDYKKPYPDTSGYNM